MPNPETVAAPASGEETGDVVCSWCHTVVLYGDHKAPRTHGICRKCRERFFPGHKKARPTTETDAR